jgi:2-oxo-4-hydroxy-4-carboxy-5-ureidoimidazoline decarboxylase
MEPLRRLDLASADEARALLSTCCGSTRWVEHMLTRRPFRDIDHLLAAARDTWYALSADDWKDAFNRHPAIGERHMSQARFAATRDLSESEQAGVSDATPAVLDALAEGNRRYEAKFGYVFVVCAAGRTAADMLARLDERLAHDPATEIQIAADEHAQITVRRLKALAVTESSRRPP